MPSLTDWEGVLNMEGKVSAMSDWIRGKFNLVDDAADSTVSFFPRVKVTLA